MSKRFIVDFWDDGKTIKCLVDTKTKYILPINSMELMCDILNALNDKNEDLLFKLESVYIKKE